MTARSELLDQVHRDHGPAMAALLWRLLYEADQTTAVLLRYPDLVGAVLRPLLIAGQLLADAVDCEADPDLDPDVAAVLRHAADRLAMTAANSARCLVLIP